MFAKYFSDWWSRAQGKFDSKGLKHSQSHLKSIQSAAATYSMQQLIPYANKETIDNLQNNFKISNLIQAYYITGYVIDKITVTELGNMALIATQNKDTLIRRRARTLLIDLQNEMQLINGK